MAFSSFTWQGRLRCACDITFSFLPCLCTAQGATTNLNHYLIEDYISPLFFSELFMALLPSSIPCQQHTSALRLNWLAKWILLYIYIYIYIYIWPIGTFFLLLLSKVRFVVRIIWLYNDSTGNDPIRVKGTNQDALKSAFGI